MQTKKQEKLLIKQIAKLEDQYRGFVLASASLRDEMHSSGASKYDTLKHRINTLENREIACLILLDEKLTEFFESDPIDQVYIAKFKYLQSRVGAALNNFDSSRIIEAINQKRQEVANAAKLKRKSSYYHEEFIWTKKLNAQLSYYFIENKSKEGMTPRQAASFTEFTDLLQTVCERQCELRDIPASVSVFDQARQKITSALDTIKKRMGR